MVLPSNSFKTTAKENNNIPLNPNKSLLVSGPSTAAVVNLVKGIVRGERNLLNRFRAELGVRGIT